MRPSVSYMDCGCPRRRALLPELCRLGRGRLSVSSFYPLLSSRGFVRVSLCFGANSSLAVIYRSLRISSSVLG